MKPSIVMAAAALCLGMAARAEVPGVGPTVNTANVPLGDRTLFGSYGENFVLLGHRMRNNDWADDDEPALRAHFSLRYVFFGRGSYETFLSYTGEFDFYMGSRPSDPVVNRLSNPAVHLRIAGRNLFDAAAPGDHVEFGLEHASDGQVVEVASPTEVGNARTAYAARDRAFFDQVSRGSNFLSLATSIGERDGGLPVSIGAKARLYLNESNRVDWGPLAGQGTKLADYHRLSLRVSKATVLGRVEAQWTLGDRGLATDSIELGWQGPKDWAFPLYVRLHRGPLNTLSNYTQRQDSIGVGLRFEAF